MSRMSDLDLERQEVEARLSSLTVMQLRRLQGAVAEELSFRSGEGAKRFQRAIATADKAIDGRSFDNRARANPDEALPF